MQLPPSVHTYFTTQAPQDSDAFAAAFAQDAIVHYEGHKYHGPQEISAWWVAAKAKYNQEAEPIDMSEVDGKTVVRANVTGDFPGSPVVLTFTFGLQGDRITDMEVG